MSLARRSSGIARKLRMNELAIGASRQRLPENLAFFSGAIDAAGSFPAESINPAEVYSYGGDLIKDLVDADHFAEVEVFEDAGEIRRSSLDLRRLPSNPFALLGAAAMEGDPVLSKRTFVSCSRPTRRGLNWATKTTTEKTSKPDWKKMLYTAAPVRRCCCAGTSIIRRWRNSLQDRRRKAYVRTMALLRSVELSKESRGGNKTPACGARCHGLDASRVADIVGRGWEGPIGADPELKPPRGAQWFMLEVKP